MDSLNELAKSMRQKQSLHPNEVNADFGMKSLVGILVVPSLNESNVHKLNALVVKKTIREQTGLNVPIFIYEGGRHACQVRIRGMKNLNNLE